MNWLSVLSIIIYTSFFIGAWHMLTAERKSVLNFSASAVLISLGWWSFCNSFFFAATTQAQAWFWHKLGAIGWCGFAALTAYYFLALTNANPKMMVGWKRVFFFLPMAILIGKNLLGSTTSLAENMIPAFHGGGWTYENSITSFWLWAYLAYVAVYFGVAFYQLYRWAKAAKHKMKREMAICFILLDAITILCGVVTDVILPLTNPVIPALASIATALFGVGYFSIIYRYDLFNINLVISSDDILQTSSNALFVMDENQEILRYNHAAGNLLGYSKNELLGMNFTTLTAEKVAFHRFNTGGDLKNIEAKLRCKDGTVKDSLLSASAAKDKRNSFLCIIVSCQDISEQKRAQEELELERENYKKLAADYQTLAYFDPLTGLPNRRHFVDTLSAFEKGYREKQSDFAMIFLDLDNFKHINDLFGHQGGDELLVVAADKLCACMEPMEFVARLGGDEFVVLLPCANPASVDRKLQQIRDEFQRSVSFYGQQYEMEFSAGYAVFSQSGDVGKLMQNADEAMYCNKKDRSA